MANTDPTLCPHKTGITLWAEGPYQLTKCEWECGQVYLERTESNGLTTKVARLGVMIDEYAKLQSELLYLRFFYENIDLGSLDGELRSDMSDLYTARTGRPVPAWCKLNSIENGREEQK